MEILKEFGLQPILLAAQAVNFFILLFLLKKFLYKPILKVLDERKQRIAESLKNAVEIEKKLDQITQDRTKKLEEASRDAKEILEQASIEATQIIKEAHSKAEGDVNRFIDKAHQSLELEREGLKKELRNEVANLVSLSLEKIINKNLSEKDKKNLLNDSIRGLL